MLCVKGGEADPSRRLPHGLRPRGPKRAALRMTQFAFLCIHSLTICVHSLTGSICGKNEIQKTKVTPANSVDSNLDHPHAVTRLCL